ncbi:MAG: hypothetical protein E7111_03440 [Bacteroidales bacterium]|nr:hypothetical protein [Bacteroidales bacterium]
MKRIIVIGIFLLAASLGMSVSAVTKNINQGESLKMNLKLSFSKEAKEDGAFVSWKLSGDWNEFDYAFSQGKLKGDVLTVKATDYKEFANGEDGLALTIKGRKKTEATTYNLSMKVIEVSDNLGFPKNKMNLDLKVNYILPPPTPWWQVALIVAAVLALVALVLAIVLIQTAKFPKGVLQLGREEVYLKGKSRVSVREELEKAGIELEGESDVILVKKRFGRFQGPCIKQMVDCTLERDGEFVSRGTVLLLDEEFKGLRDAQGNEVLLRYY